MPFWVGKSRIEAARLVERSRCADVISSYIKELSTWTAADDHGLDRARRQAVVAALMEAERRIRNRSTDAD